VWETAGPRIRGAYAKQWREWQEEVVRGRPNRHIPGLVAEAFATTSLGSFPLKVGGDPWELRLARVEPRGARAVVWERLGPA
jgi:hypothetical protein